MTKTKTVVSTTTTMFKARHLWSRAECAKYAATSISPYTTEYLELRARVRAEIEARQAGSRTPFS
jgi:hypothetical protein